MKFKSDENGNLIPIEDPNETNKVATNIPSNNSENNSDKSFRYQDPTKNKTFVYQDPTKSKTFVYQDGKENDHNISQNSNEYIDDLSPTPSEKEAQQSLNSTSMYSQQNPPHLNGQQFYPSHQNAVEHEKYKHHFEPITLDDCTFCITYVAKFKIDSNQRLTFKNYSELAQELMCTHKKDTIDIARLYIVKAIDYDTKIKLELYYINANDIRQHKVLFIDKELCKQGKLYEELTRNDIHCFNADLSHKKISDYLYKLILSKMENGKFSMPQHHGFNILDNEVYFITSEFCTEKEFPIITDKTFKVDIADDYTYEKAENEFVNILTHHKNKEQFLLLNMIRITGLISYILSQNGIKFNKLIFINGESEILSKYLQIYDRDRKLIKPYSINVKPKEIENKIGNEFDSVIMFEDKQTDSEFTRKNGIEAVNFLCDALYNWCNNDDSYMPYISVIFSKRLNQLIESKWTLNLDFSSFAENSQIDTKTYKAVFYYIDNLIVKRICNDNSDFTKSISILIDKYNILAKQYGVDSSSFICLMIAYHEIIRQYRSIENVINEETMLNYIASIIKRSDDTYNGGDITEEFKRVLNKTIIDGEIELVENSAINNCYGSSGTKPVVFCDDNWLYFPKETFEYLVPKVTLANNSLSIKNSLYENNLLKISDRYTYKVTLYDVRYSGKVTVTAVSYSVLNEEAIKKRIGGMFNFTPCDNDGQIERIPLGIDEKGRQLYWSIGHDEIGNSHLLINGISGMGKTTVANSIVKKLFNEGQHIVYVDFSNSDSPDKLINSGFDKHFQDAHFYRCNIKSCLSNTKELDDALEMIKTENTILVFETDKYGAETEDFLEMIYDKVTSDSTLSIFLVIDEAHDLNYKKGSPIYNIMEKGRGNGISLISIFQGPHETKKPQYSMMNQSELKLIFKLSDRTDAEKVVESNSLKPKNLFTDKIMRLKKRHCLAIGSLESSDGEILSGRFIEISIPEV